MLYVINKIMSGHYSEEFIPIEGKTKVAKILTKFADVQYGLEEDIQFISKDENRRQMFVYLNTLERVKPVIDFIAKNLDALVYAIKKIPVNSQNRIEVLRNFILEDPPLQIKEEDFVIPGVDVKFMKLLSFPISKRPITDMTRFWDRYNSVTREFVDISKIDSALKLLPDNSASILYETVIELLSYEQLFYIPILRYEGMHRGMFFGHSSSSSSDGVPSESELSYEESSSEVDEGETSQPPENEFCGTFFYYEPESPAWLKTENLCIAVNKVHAFKVLGMPFDELFEMWESHFVTDDIVYLFQPIDALLGVPEDQITHTYVKPKSGSGKQPVTSNGSLQSIRDLTIKLLRKMYDLDYIIDNFYVEMYAFEDFFDQWLCKYAKEKGVDTVLLIYMNASTRLVSEVLDTRDRNAIFDNMIINRV